MMLNAEQSAAVEMARRIRKCGGVGILNGPAGTGKTSTLKAIMADCEGRGIVACPTSRAAVRARQHAGVRSCTIHSLLYNPHEDEKTGKVTWKKKNPDQVEDRAGGFVVVDEASMMSASVWAELSDVCGMLGIGILLVGDGEQLPPYRAEGEPYFSVFSRDFPHDEKVTLRTVMRQRGDSPVLDLATRVRESESWREVVAALYSGTVPWASESAAYLSAQMHRNKEDHVVIAHKNATRQALNVGIRSELGMYELCDVEDGEPMLIRRNCAHPLVSNGEVVPFKAGDQKPLSLWKGSALLHSIVIDGVQARVHKPTLMTGNDGAVHFKDWRKMHDLSDKLLAPLIRAHLGYAVTCHAAQGGEWDTVFLVVEGSLHVMEEDERRKWIYTAVTRAQKNLVLVRG